MTYSVEEKVVGFDTRIGLIEGLLRVPNKPGPKKAVIFIHSGNGCGIGMASTSTENATAPYCRYLSSIGYVTFEPRFFLGRENRSEYRDLPLCFDCLKYLSEQDFVDKNHISITGLSYGGFLSLAAATLWAQEKYQHLDTEFRSFLVFYPICWIIIDHINRIGGYSDFPPDLFDRWSKKPIAIFQGGNDDYEDKDPHILEELISSIKDEDQRKMIYPFFYPNDTHGWDRGYTYSFEDPHAHKGKGGVNTNIYNKETTLHAIRKFIWCLEHF